MKKKEVENRIAELKSDYTRLQADLDKMGTVGGNTERGEKQLEAMEVELAELNRRLDEQE